MKLSRSELDSFVQGGNSKTAGLCSTDVGITLAGPCGMPTADPCPVGEAFFAPKQNLREALNGRARWAAGWKYGFKPRHLPNFGKYTAVVKLVGISRSGIAHRDRVGGPVLFSLIPGITQPGDVEATPWAQGIPKNILGWDRGQDIQASAIKADDPFRTLEQVKSMYTRGAQAS